jgi:hypothetical protein
VPALVILEEAALANRETIRPFAMYTLIVPLMLIN